MMTDLEFDQLLESTLMTRGTQTGGDSLADRVMTDVRATHQRGSMVPALDSRAWPPTRGSLADPAMARGLRLALVALLALVLTSGALLAGRELLDRVQPVPPELRGVLTTRMSLPDDRPATDVLVMPDGRLLLLHHPIDGSIALVVDLGSGGMTPVVTSDPDFTPLMSAVLSTDDVLLVGVSGEDGVARILDPETMEVGPPIPMLAPRHGGAITALTDGRVLVTGGAASTQAPVSLASAELFDPGPGVFEATGSMTLARAGHALTPLSDGRVLVSGGSTTRDRRLSGGSPPEQISNPVSDVEVYDPTTGRFERVAELHPVARSWSGSESVPPVRMPDGRVLIFRGQQGQFCGRHGTDPIATQLFDPTTDALSDASAIPHSITTATPLPDGRIVVTGAWSFGACQEGTEYVYDAWIGIHDPASGVTLESRDPRSGVASLSMDTDREYYAAAPLLDGTIALISHPGVFGAFQEVAAPVIDVVE
jgi:hypothetical protein